MNAAGLFLPKPFIDHDGADYDSYQELNRAIFFLTQTVAKGMVGHGRPADSYPGLAPGGDDGYPLPLMN